MRLRSSGIRPGSARTPAQRRHTEFSSCSECSHVTRAEACGRDGQRIEERRAERRQLDFELIARLHSNAIRKAERGRAEEMQVNVAGHAVRSVLEVMEFEVG